ncbi:MAG: 2'-5' RNA ligase family protein [Rhizobiales bacterium]|nr:2'-5' RNA ligase family protein [Hyphomicrobiales bacterium]
MDHAITITARNDSGLPIRGLWDAFARFEPASSMQALNYAPHFTFAIYRDVNPEAVSQAFVDAFSGRPPISIVFDRIAVFDAASPVVWAAPRDASALAGIHAVIHGMVDPAHCHRHYRPRAWVPHCTLATRILPARRAEVLALAAPLAEPFEVVFDVADHLTLPPLTVVEQLHLR